MRTRACLAASALLLAVLGCRDDTMAPTDPARTTPQTTVAAATALAFWQVSGGKDHTCGVTTDYFAYCWGNNSLGSLGDGTIIQHTTPVAVVGGLRFKQVSAGWSFTCGVTTDNRAYCWGDNSSGELGNGTRAGPERCGSDVVGGISCSTRPVAVAGGLRFAQVEVGTDHACGVTTTDRRAYCWGGNGNGQLGDGTLIARLTPVAVRGGLQFRQVSLSYLHTCGVTTDYVAYCWGDNSEGQIGDSTNITVRLRPTRVSGTRQFRQIDAGVAHTCAVTTSDRAFCWGNGRWGQLGNGKTYLSFWPRAVAGGLSFRRVTAGWYHTCGETTSNRAYCWGLNYDGSLGDGTSIPHLTPVAVIGGFYFKQVSAGWVHTCGKTSAAVLYCWGNNGYGMLGDGTYTSRLRPTRVAGAM
jgi:hypothetical protein